MLLQRFVRLLRKYLSKNISRRRNRIRCCYRQTFPPTESVVRPCTLSRKVVFAECVGELLDTALDVVLSLDHQLLVVVE